MTTFLTMVYIVFVNPQNPRRGTNGPESGVCYHLFDCRYRRYVAMGIFANLPVALAPAMGLNAFFAFVVVGAMGISGRPGWAQYSGAQLDYFCSRCFVSGTG
ncbi:hypothetical protein ACLB1N_25190 [Escherichia coli]